MLYNEDFDPNTVSFNEDVKSSLDSIILNIKTYLEQIVIEYNGEKYVILFNDNAKLNVMMYMYESEIKTWVEQPHTLLKTYFKNIEFVSIVSKKYTLVNDGDVPLLYGAMKKINKTDRKNMFKLFYTKNSLKGVNTKTRTVHKLRSDFEELAKAESNIKQLISPELDTQIGMPIIMETVTRLMHKNNVNKKKWFFKDVEQELNLPIFKAVKHNLEGK